MKKSESRYFKTAAQMDSALIQLLKKKPFEYITVSELCKTAHVNRATFYLHYENLGELLEETAMRLIDTFLSYFDADSGRLSIDFADCELDELYFIHDKYLIPYLNYIKENREVFSTASLNMKTFGFDRVYNLMFENIFSPILARFHFPEDERKYVIKFYLNGVNAVTEQWLCDGCEKSVCEIAKIISKCANPNTQNI